MFLKNKAYAYEIKQNYGFSSGIFAIVGATACSEGHNEQTPKPPHVSSTLENTLYMELKSGRVVIDLLPDLAPKHVARIKVLTRQNYYDGLKFHRVIDGFMAQTGDPTGTGSGGSGQKLKDELSNHPHVRGTISMARKGDPNSADSQFFIVYAPAPHLDGKYSVWGQVRSGMEHVDQIKKGGTRRGLYE